MVARGFWIPVFWWLAAVTMVVGNLIALQQKSVKRMLAYSSIAHAGYLLVAVTASSHDAMSAMLFYMVAYSLATMGAFAVVVAVSGRGERGQRIDDLAGLWQERPWLATAMALFMLSLLGFPLAGGMGFWGKWYLLKAAVSNAVPLTSLAVVLVLTSVVSAGYYLNVVVTMYMKPRAADAPALPATPRLTALVIGLAAAGLIYFGVQPGLLVRWARDAMDTPSTLRPPAVNVTAAAPQR
jgi:NADH-quinone oxidoreductase subunit N